MAKIYDGQTKSKTKRTGISRSKKVASPTGRSSKPKDWMKKEMASPSVAKSRKKKATKAKTKRSYNPVKAAGTGMIGQSTKKRKERIDKY